MAGTKDIPDRASRVYRYNDPHFVVSLRTLTFSPHGTSVLARTLILLPDRDRGATKVPPSKEILSFNNLIQRSISASTDGIQEFARTLLRAAPSMQNILIDDRIAPEFFVSQLPG